MLIHKSIIPKRSLPGKSKCSVGINFFAECGTDGHPRHQLDVDVYTHETSDTAVVTLVHPGQGKLQNVRLNLTEEAMDDLRRVLYEVSNQLMLNRSRRRAEAAYEKEKKEAFEAAGSMQLKPAD